MTCEEVRGQLPAYSGGELTDAGELEVHLASCEGCASELARYRELAYSLRAMGERVEEPSPAFMAKVVAAIPPRRLRDDVRRIAREHPREVALGSAALGAAAIGMLWWRTARRSAGRERVLVPAS